MSLLPGPLRAALQALAQGRGRSDLARRSAAISATYQARRNSSQSLLTADDALAYALARMPATYAATLQVLRELVSVQADFSPRSVLDIGCGPGTASFAAAEVFAGLANFALLDRNGPFLELAKTLAGEALSGKDVRILDQDVSRALAADPADLVIGSYVLAELGAAQLAVLVPALWQATRHALVLVEPGTPDGFARLKSVRNALISEGAYVAAPCTHEAPCPMAGDRWCRFFARVQRSRDHRMLKGGEKPYEDEPYAYLVLTRQPPQARMSHRVVGRPVETKAEVALPVCGLDGLQMQSAAHRNKTLFKRYKCLDWGDAVQIQIQESLAEHQVASQRSADS